jgi:hypothetical protein
MSKYYREAKYRRPNIDGQKSPKKTWVTSRFLAKILPMPISPNFLEIYPTNYFMGVMNDVIFSIELPKSTFFKFYLISFGEVFNSTHFGDSIHSNLL